MCVEKVKRKKITFDCLFPNAFRLQSFLKAKIFYQNYFSIGNNYGK